MQKSVGKSQSGRLRALSGMLWAMLEYLLLLLSLLGSAVRDRDVLVAENLLLRHQLAVLTRPTRKPPRLRAPDKLFWVVVRALRRDWRRHLVVVRPESVIRWHPQAWRFFRRWRSRGPIGRPRLSVEVRELIATMARDNPVGVQQQVLGHEIVARARPSQDDCEQQPQYFEHAFSIADLRRARFCRRTAPHSRPSPPTDHCRS